MLIRVNSPHSLSCHLDGTVRGGASHGYNYNRNHMALLNYGPRFSRSCPSITCKPNHVPCTCNRPGLILREHKLVNHAEWSYMSVDNSLHVRRQFPSNGESVGQLDPCNRMSTWQRKEVLDHHPPPRAKQWTPQQSFHFNTGFFFWTGKMRYELLTEKLFYLWEYDTQSSECQVNLVVL